MTSYDVVNSFSVHDRGACNDCRHCKIIFKQVISEARKVWDRMKNKDDCKVGMTHDGEVMERVKDVWGKQEV